MLALKALALASLPLGWVLASLCVAHSLSRAVAVSLNCWLPYAGDPAHAKAKPLAQQVSVGSWGVACAWPLALIVAFALARHGSETFALPSPQAWAAALVAAIVTGLACARWFRRRLGGVTGDTLGASQQLSELAVYLAVLAMLGR
jgi:adenosylcobinamide-GDP ribazoletransferase